MKRIFGAKKEPAKTPTLDEATENLTKRGDALDEKIRKLDEQLLKHRAGLRALRPGPALEAAKRRALVVLKQRRLYESQRDQLYQQQANVDGAAFTMQSMQDTVQVVQAMQAGSKAMATMMKKNKELQVDKIWKTMDGLADLQADFEEIQDAVGAYNVPDGVDDDELLGELDALEEEMAAEGPAAAGAAPAYLDELLPAAPAEAPAAAEATPAPPAGALGLPAGAASFGR